MRKLLFYDTETTGLPTCYTAPHTDVHNWPRIIELAWELCYEDGTTIRKGCDLIEPDGWKMPTDEFWIENGFTQDGNELCGIPIAEALEKFVEAWEEADVLIAHNLSYDYPITNCELFRLGLKIPKSRTFCTKLASENICKIPGYKGKYKWPTLTEAYRFFYKKEFDGAHHAGWDVDACKQVFLGIVKYHTKVLEQDLLEILFGDNVFNRKLLYSGKPIQNLKENNAEDLI